MMLVSTLNERFARNRSISLTMAPQLHLKVGWPITEFGQQAS